MIWMNMVSIPCTGFPVCFFLPGFAPCRECTSLLAGSTILGGTYEVVAGTCQSRQVFEFRKLYTSLV